MTPIFLILFSRRHSRRDSAYNRATAVSRLGLALAAVPWVLVFVLEKVYGKAWFAAQPSEAGG